MSSSGMLTFIVEYTESGMSHIFTPLASTSLPAVMSLPALNSRMGSRFGSAFWVPIHTTVIRRTMSGRARNASATLVMAPKQSTNNGWSSSRNASSVMNAAASDSGGCASSGPSIGPSQPRSTGTSDPTRFLTRVATSMDRSMLPDSAKCSAQIALTMNFGVSNA